MKITRTLQIAAAAVFVLAAVLLPSQIAAATLDGKAAGNLLSGRDMASKNVAGEGFYYWTWNADGSVCMRLQEKNGKCADTGTWKVERDRVCYAFTWWGKSSGFAANCFRISEDAKGHYEAIQDNGMRLFEFTVGK